MQGRCHRVCRFFFLICFQERLPQTVHTGGQSKLEGFESRVCGTDQIVFPQLRFWADIRSFTCSGRDLSLGLVAGAYPVYVSAWAAVRGQEGLGIRESTIPIFQRNA